MTVTGLRLDPMDLLFFRGSRPMGANAAAESGLPHPQTLAGALRTHLLRAAGFDFGAFTAARRRASERPARELLAELGAPKAILDLRFRGPWLCRGRGREVEEVYLPTPRGIYCDNGHTPVARAWPTDPGTAAGRFWKENVTLPDGLSLPVQAPQRDDLKQATGFLGLKGLAAFLRGELPCGEDLVPPTALYAFDRRVGIGIDPEGSTVQKGLLYGAPLLSLRPQVGFYVEVRGDETTAHTLDGASVRFGGEARRVVAQRVERRPSGGVDGWSVTPKGPSRALVCLSPGHDRDRAVPERLRGVLRAASVGRPTLHSGFDIARGGPRRTRSMIPAGSVFFVEGELDPVGSIAASDADAAVGEGLYVTGEWKR